MKKKILGITIAFTLAILSSVTINYKCNNSTHNFALLFENIEALASGEGSLTGQACIVSGTLSGNGVPKRTCANSCASLNFYINTSNATWSTCN